MINSFTLKRYKFSLNKQIGAKSYTNKATYTVTKMQNISQVARVTNIILLSEFYHFSSSTKALKYPVPEETDSSTTEQTGRYYEVQF